MGRPELIVVLLFAVLIVGWVLQDKADRRANQEAMQALSELREWAKEDSERGRAARLTLRCFYG